jgi:hypothetical protein
MRFQIATSRRRVAGLAGAGALVLGAVAGVAAYGAGTADAATVPCNAVETGPPAVAATTCSATGTATLTAGALTLTTPALLTWGTVLGGAAQQVVDAVAADQSLTVDDATGSGAGWNISLTASQFTIPTTTDTLPVLGTFAVNGSITAETPGVTPGTACTVPVPVTVPVTPPNCTVPTSTTDPVTYPVPVTTDGATSAIIYTADAGTGIGSIALGAASAGAPIGWWVNVPGDALAGGYASTVILTIASGP